jgi:pyruvate ferredoxin oxidoreductase alpha subunit
MKKRENKLTVKICDGNKAAAYGVLLAKPDVVGLYPITPQSSIGEQLALFKAEGKLDAEMVEVEGENSAMGSVMGASIAGGRVFTATSSWGLVYMYDGLMYAAGLRAPIVMVDVTREPPLTRGVLSSRQDLMSVRDSGWVQIEAATCQEILDCILMAYRLAEDSDILLPIMIGYDGFYLSHLSEPIDIPSQKTVDSFFRPGSKERIRISTQEPLQFSTTPPVGDAIAEFRYKHCQALERVKKKLPSIEKEFESLFERSYGGLVETYRVEDAEIVLFTAGSCAGTVKVFVDEAREAGEKVGLARLRVFRPFPHERLIEILKDKKGVGVIDRSVCLGWNCGHLYMELNAIRHQLPRDLTVVDFIDGLASLDITRGHIAKAFTLTQQAVEGKNVPAVNWLMF